MERIAKVKGVSQRMVSLKLKLYTLPDNVKDSTNRGKLRLEESAGMNGIETII